MTEKTGKLAGIEMKIDLPVTKGILFGGCSFTWGQGLYYYSNLSTLKEPPPDQYHDDIVTPAHKEYVKTIRTPRLVANHFNTFEDVRLDNGGSVSNSIEWLDKIIEWTNDSVYSSTDGHHAGYPDYIKDKYQASEIGLVVLQVTQPHRTRMRNNHYQPGGFVYYNILMHMSGEEGHEWVKSWMERTGINTLDKLENAMISETMSQLKYIANKLQQNNIGLVLTTWPSEMVNPIKEDELLSSLLCEFNYNGKVYSSMEEMMGSNPELVIHSDPTFTIPPRDHHPSKLCHRVVADNLIEFIEKKKLV